MAGLRAYVTEALPESGNVVLGEHETRHLVRSLRAREGDEVLLFDGRGGQWQGVLAEAGRKEAVVAIEAQLPEAPRPMLTLAQALPKGKGMDDIIRRAVEVGVRAIHPLTTDHCEVRLDGDRAAQKREHWHVVAVEACKQSGSAWLPELAMPQRLDLWLEEYHPVETRFVASLEPGAPRLLEAVADEPEGALVLVGPEGDFSEREYALIAHYGFTAVRLGDLVLRCETAALYALSVLDAHFKRGR